MSPDFWYWSEDTCLEHGWYQCYSEYSLLAELLLQDAELPQAAEGARGRSASATRPGDPRRQAVSGLPAEPCSDDTSGGNHSGEPALLGAAKQ